MLEELFEEVYEKFKLNFYRSIFSGFEYRDASLSALETFCVEVIYALERPTINELALFLNISQPNAAYKVASLVKKGYVVKVQSDADKREYYLELTDRFYDYLKIKNEYVDQVISRFKERFNEEDIEKLEYFLKVISDELMPEVTSFIRERRHEEEV
ncbi:winged helix DNA-binding protein [Microaceticoccus formicicus]|uniref:winged helix DNA-binding protein n=1 Tax=Microaceticoccus formicicus TaxID=3118105 RepID=UPI003CD009CA|nr:winged helix DNA-binding protein [Peptoniphilaceae bacterium AMB_02]